MPTEKDAFHQWWEWETKGKVAAANIHDAAMTLTAEERLDRAMFNEAVRTQMSGWECGLVRRTRGR